MVRPGDRQTWAGGRPAAPFDIVRAAHCELVVTDLARSREFYAGALGLAVTEETARALYLRGYEDRHHHCLALRLGPRPAVGHVAFLVASEDDLGRAATYYRARGCPVRIVERENAGQPRAVRVHDPLGFPLEFFANMTMAESLLQRYDLHRGARIMRLDHFNLHVPDVQAAFDYYYGALGFRCSEYIAGDPPPGVPDGPLYAAWLFRKPNVHDVALTAGAGPRLHHLAFWTADTDAIIGFCDQLGGAGRYAAIERGPGRHGIGNAFYLYLRDPDGHRVELYTSDYWTGDPDLQPRRWSAGNAQRRSFWGHEVPERWYRESSEVLGPDGLPVPLSEPAANERAVEVLPQ